MLRLVMPAVVALALLGCGERPAASPDAAFDIHDVAELSAPDAPIAFRRSLVADEYFWLRAKALEGEAPAPFAEALAAMKDLRGDFSDDPTAWEDLEVPLGAARSARELAETYAGLPIVKDAGGKTVQLREHALRLAHAMDRATGAFRSGPGHDHDAVIAAAAQDLALRLVPREGAILGAIRKDMALPDAGRPIVVTLIFDAPYPGIFAADARGRTMASFVRVRGLAGDALVETVLHESLHAIDEVTVRTPTTAMNALRVALARRGIDESDPNVEMAVNTVTFAEAASLVRRFVDPAHRPLGETGFYALFPPANDIVAAWDRHLAGEELEETAGAVARAVSPPTAPEPP